MIERTGPLRIHKNLVTMQLRYQPEQLAQIAPDWKGTAQQLIDYLKADSRQWIVGGVLEDDDATATGFAKVNPPA